MLDELIRKSAKAGVSIMRSGLLVDLCRAVNREVRTPDGDTGFCIFASAILQDVLLALGYWASVMRVETGIFPDNHGRLATILGGFGDGTRRPRSAPGMWKGHLVAVTEGHLLDATIDQVNNSHGLALEPLVIAVPPEWFRGSQTAFVSIAECLVRYTAYPNLGGFKSAPDFRPSRRQEIVQALSVAFSNEEGRRRA